MAQLPKPLGIGDTLNDIARGLGDAARAIPMRSRSEVGALAVKRALVQLDFEMALSTRSSEQGIGVGPELGVRTLRFGIGLSDRSSEFTGASRGHIELEVVAILDGERAQPGSPAADPEPEPAPRPTPAPTEPKPTPVDPPAVDVVALQTALKIWLTRSSDPALSDRDRAEIRSAVAKAEARLAKGDIDGAARLIAELAERYSDLEHAALGRAIGELRAAVGHAELDPDARAKLESALDLASRQFERGDRFAATQTLLGLRQHFGGSSGA